MLGPELTFHLIVSPLSAQCEHQGHTADTAVAAWAESTGSESGKAQRFSPDPEPRSALHSLTAQQSSLFSSKENIRHGAVIVGVRQ